jgi:hypothetical protein
MQHKFFVLAFCFIVPLPLFLILVWPRWRRSPPKNPTLGEIQALIGGIGTGLFIASLLEYLFEQAAHPYIQMMATLALVAPMIITQLSAKKSSKKKSAKG